MSLKLIFDLQDNATPQARKLKAELDKLNISVKSSELQNKKLDASFASLAKQAIVLYGTYRVLSGVFGGVIKTGLEYNRVIEQQQQGIATLVASLSKNRDSLGNVLTAQQKFNLATEQSIGIMTELERINAKLPTTLSQTAQIYKAILPSFTQAGASQKDLIDLTEKLAIAQNVAGIEANSFIATIDSIASGTVIASSDLGKFLNALGLTNDVLKESKDVTKLVLDTFKDFKTLDNYATAVSNFEDEWDKLTGTLTKDIFFTQKESLKELTGLLSNLNSNKQDLVALQNFINGFSSGLITVVGTVVRAANASRLLFEVASTGIENSFLKAKIVLNSFELSALEVGKNIKEAFGLDTTEITKSIGLIDKELVSIGKEIEQNNKEYEAFRLEAIRVDNILLDTENALKKNLSAEKLITEEAKKQNTERAKGNNVTVKGTLVTSIPASAIEFRKKLEDLGKTSTQKELENLKQQFEANKQFIDQNSQEYRNYYDYISKLNKQVAEEQKQLALQKLEDENTFISGAKAGAISLKDEYDNNFRIGQQAVQSFATNSTNAIMQFAETGKLSFSDFARSVINDLARIIIQQQIAGFISSAITSIGGSGTTSTGTTAGVSTTTSLNTPYTDLYFNSVNADGGVFQGGVQKFANGGAFTNSIVSSPTLFPMANGGTGLMGESGAEAIIPLDRDSSGKLGVNASGLSGTNVNVIINNNANTDVQTSQRQDSQGNIDILVDIVEQRLSSGAKQGTSDFSNTLEQLFGLNRGGR